MLMLRRRAPKGPRIHTQAYKHEPRPRNHKAPSAHKVHEDRGKGNQKHGMEKKRDMEKKTKGMRGMDATHPPPHPHTLHTLSL